MAGSDINTDTEPFPGKVTIGLMGKGAVMSSHGEKHLCLSVSLSLPNVRVKETRRESWLVQTQTRRKLTLMGAVTLLLADPRAGKP